MFPKLRATALVVCAFFILVLSVPALGQSDDAAKETANPFHELHFRPLGPVGNRTAAVVGEPKHRPSSERVRSSLCAFASITAFRVAN